MKRLLEYSAQALAGAIGVCFAWWGLNSGLYLAKLLPSTWRFPSDNAMGATANATEALTQIAAGAVCCLPFLVAIGIWVAILLHRVNSSLDDIARRP